MIRFAVVVKNVEKTGSGKMHTSNFTVPATSYKDAYAIARAINQTSNHEHKREAIVNFIVSTRQGNSYFPTEQLDEVCQQLVNVKEAMQSDPGPPISVKKSVLNTY